MPKKFPLVTSLVWSPAHRSKKKNVSGGSGEAGETESPRTGQQPAAAARSQESPRAGQRDDLHVKEHILFTDVDSQLYHFSVEGKYKLIFLVLRTNCRTDIVCVCMFDDHSVKRTVCARLVSCTDGKSVCQLTGKSSDGQMIS